MSDVFTTLTMVKMRLNDGEIPAMEELTDRAKKICDPEFTPGMGALDADPETTKLRCPVRGCGEYYHRLGFHIDRQHGDVGGRERIKRVLSLPVSATLISEQGYENVKSIGGGFEDRGPPTAPKEKRCTAPTNNGERCTNWICNQSDGDLCYIHWIHDDPERARKQKKNAATSNGTGNYRTRTGYRNFHNTCREQIAQRILSVRDRVRRTPSVTEADHYDPGLVRSATHLYGSWNAALADCNLQTRKPGNPAKKNKDDVVSLIEAFVNYHGRLPKSTEAGNGAIPPVPSRQTITRVFGAESYVQAMRRAAYLLGVDPGPYDISLTDPVSTSQAAQMLGLSRGGARHALRRNEVASDFAIIDGNGTRFWERSGVESLHDKRTSGLDEPITTDEAAEILGLKDPRWPLKKHGVTVGKEVCKGGRGYRNVWERSEVEALAEKRKDA